VRSSGVPTGNLGGQVQNINVKIADADRIPTNQDKVVTISFTTQTQLLQSHVATITSTLFVSSSSLSIVGQSPAGAFSGVQSGQSGSITLTSTAQNLNTFTITISGISLGSPRTDTSTSVSTTTDATNFQQTGPLGGAPHHPFRISSYHLIKL
jgi:hypothetical protein